MGYGPGEDSERLRLPRNRFFQSWQRQVNMLRQPVHGFNQKPDLHSLRHTHASLMLDAGMKV